MNTHQKYTKILLSYAYFVLYSMVITKSELDSMFLSIILKMQTKVS